MAYTGIVVIMLTIRHHSFVVQNTLTTAITTITVSINRTLFLVKLAVICRAVLWAKTCRLVNAESCVKRGNRYAIKLVHLCQHGLVLEKFSDWIRREKNN